MGLIFGKFSETREAFLKEYGISRAETEGYACILNEKADRTQSILSSIHTVDNVSVITTTGVNAMTNDMKIDCENPVDGFFPLNDVVYAIESIKITSVLNRTPIDMNFRVVITDAVSGKKHEFKYIINHSCEQPSLNVVLYESKVDNYLMEYAGMEELITGAVVKKIDGYKMPWEPEKPIEFTILKKQSMCANFIMKEADKIYKYWRKQKSVELDVALYKLLPVNNDEKTKTCCSVVYDTLTAAQSYIKANILDSILYVTKDKISFSVEVSEDDKKKLLQSVNSTTISTNTQSKQTSNTVVVQLKISYYIIKKEKTSKPFFIFQ